jgi:putative mycofactocin binding protein MftB
MESAASTEHEPGEAAYELAPGTRVRAERTGLLFYQRRGPRLHYLFCRSLLAPEFFSSGLTLREWLNGREVSSVVVESLERALSALKTKGVVCARNGSP